LGVAVVPNGTKDRQVVTKDRQVAARAVVAASNATRDRPAAAAPRA